MVSKTLVSDELYQYVWSHSNVLSAPLQALIDRSLALDFGMMVTAADQIQLIQWLIRLMNAKQILEIGTFTGCTTYAMAEAAPDDAQIITCDYDSRWVVLGQPYWKEAGFDQRIAFKCGQALDTMQVLLESGRTGQFDLIYIDADKENAIHYYEKSLLLLRQGGVVLIDNMLFGGGVIDSDSKRPSVKVLRALAKQLHTDDRVDYSFLTVGDGLAMLRKR